MSADPSMNGPPPLHHLHGTATTPNGSNASEPAVQDKGEVRTIFISGWPNDIKQREVYNLMRFQPGFEGAMLHNRGKPIAFVTFKERESAILAMSAFQGLKFDVESVSSELRVELAKANSNVNPNYANNYNININNSPNSSIMSNANPNPQVNIIHSQQGQGQVPPASSNVNSHINLNHHNPHTNANGNPLNSSVQINDRNDRKRSAEEEQNENELSDKRFRYQGQTPAAANLNRYPPIPSAGSVTQTSNRHGTLYVVNISPNVTEEELRECFGAFPGYRALKVKPVRSGLASIAWVDYTTYESAQSAMDQLQGHRLPGGLGPAIKIEFAKSPMNLGGQSSTPSPGSNSGSSTVASSPHPSAPLNNMMPPHFPVYGFQGYPPAGYPGYPLPHSLSLPHPHTHPHPLSLSSLPSGPGPAGIPQMYPPTQQMPGYPHY